MNARSARLQKIEAAASKIVLPIHPPEASRFMREFKELSRWLSVDDIDDLEFALNEAASRVGSVRAPDDPIAVAAMRPILDAARARRDAGQRGF